VKEKTPGGNQPAMAPGTFTYPLTATTIGSLTVTHSLTWRRYFQAAQAANLRNSCTVERLSQPPRATAGGGSSGPTPSKASRTAIGSCSQLGSVKWLRVTTGVIPRRRRAASSAA